MTALLRSFADPVGDAQACFRAVLDALARPGTVHRAGAGLTPPHPLGKAAAAVLLTLTDSDTRLWLDDAVAPARPWLAFHTGAVFTDEIGAAAFVHARALPDFRMLRGGSDAAPEESATLVLEVAAIGTGTPLRLDGPGLAEAGTLRVAGLADGFRAAWAANRALYPRGIDLILTSGTSLAALPRSVIVHG